MFKNYLTDLKSILKLKIHFVKIAQKVMDEEINSFRLRLVRFGSHISSCYTKQLLNNCMKLKSINSHLKIGIKNFCK